jgi:hypothetical protein
LGTLRARLKVWHRMADNSVIREATDEHGEDGRTTAAGAADRRFTLPSGQVVQVMRGQRTLPQCLHICPRCDSNLVQPIDWGDADADRWEVALRCPNCHWGHRGTFHGDQLADLEDKLDTGFDELLHDLRRLTAANMADEIERFANALAVDLILPEDF